MPQIRLDLGDAAELAETLTFLTRRLSGSQKQILADSFAVFADLHRFAFLLGETDGEELFGQPTPEGDTP